MLCPGHALATDDTPPTHPLTSVCSTRRLVPLLLLLVAFSLHFHDMPCVFLAHGTVVPPSLDLLCYSLVARLVLCDFVCVLSCLPDPAGVPSGRQGSTISH